MTTQTTIREFLSHKKLAIAGLSRSGKGFGNAVHRELTAKGYKLVPIHPDAESIAGVPCRKKLAEVAGEVGGLILVVPPAQTERLVEEAAAAGIRRVWMQQGAESEAAIRFCQEHDLEVIHDQCILMFAEPAGFIHRFHHWLWSLLGKLPAKA